MKKNGILNRDIASALAKLGHTDFIVIVDCGFPIPSGMTCVDVSLKPGMPAFFEVVDVVIKEMVVEKGIYASEIKKENHDIYRALKTMDFPLEELSHKEFKEKTKRAKVIIRTGEATPYSNIILKAGTIF